MGHLTLIPGECLVYHLHIPFCKYADCNVVGKNTLIQKGGSTMKQLLVAQCDCCGLSVDPQTTENCPRCNYPVNPDKEERFLESAINDLQRVANYGGENIRVAELIRRYQFRLNAVRHLKELSSPVVPLVPVGAQSHVAPIAAQPFTPHVEEAKVAPAPVLSPKIEQVVTAPPPVRPQPPRRVFSLRSFFADQAINIVASVGAFLLLIGSLSFTIDGQQLTLTPEEVLVVATARPGFVTAEERGYIVALETTITPKLREEGLVRDLTHYVQDMRKRAGFNIEDHIQLALLTEQEELATILRSYQETLRSETLADTLFIGTNEQEAPALNEVYREKVSPTSLKKLEGYTVEVVLGKL